jgi:hypothetical protein
MRGTNGPTFVAACCMALAWTGAARAQEIVATVHLDAPAECPDRASVEREIARLLQTSSSESVEATMRVTRNGESLELVLDVRGGSRRLTSVSCDDLLRAAALVVAMAVDPDAVERAESAPGAVSGRAGESVSESESESESESASESASESESESESASESAAGLSVPAESVDAPITPAGRARRVSVFAGAHATLIIGALPRATMGASLVVGIAMPGLEVSLAGSLSGSSATNLVTVPDAGARFRLAFGRVQVGLPFRIGSTTVVPHVFFDLGAMSWESFGVTHPGAGTSVWLSPGVGIEARFALTGWLAVSSFADLLVPIHRPDFFLDELPGAETAHTAAPFAFSVGLGLTVQIPPN